MYGALLLNPSSENYESKCIKNTLLCSLLTDLYHLFKCVMLKQACFPEHKTETDIIYVFIYIWDF